MTREDAKKMLKAKLECLKRETSGTDIDCNNKNCDECNLCYEQGNMGEQKEALELAIKALKQQPCDDVISRQAVLDGLANIAKVKARSDAQKSLMGRAMFFVEQLPPVTPKPMPIVGRKRGAKQ